MGIVEIELRGLHLRLVGDDRRLVLGDQRLLVRHLLLGDRILLAQRQIAVEIALRLGEQRLVLGQLALRLRERGLVGSRIDLGEEVALLDDLAFVEPQLLQLARDLGADGHGLEGRDGAERVDGDRHVAERDSGDSNGLRRRSGAAGVRALRRRRGAGLTLLDLLPGEHRGRGQDDDQRDPEQETATPRRLLRRRGRFRLELRLGRRRTCRGPTLRRVRFEGFIHSSNSLKSPLGTRKTD